MTMNTFTSLNGTRCLTVHSKQIPVLAKNFSNTRTIFNQTPSLQIEEQLIKEWVYFYRTCNKRWVFQRLQQTSMYCKCLDSWKKCKPERGYIEACNTILIGLASAQIIIAIIGIILNLFIAIPFLRDAQLRNRNANILIFNQAIADLVNCIVYGMPNAINLLRATINQEQVPYQLTVTQATLVFTIASSIFTFSVIAIERYLSISRPLWHKANVRKKHLYTSIAILWILSTLLATIRAYTTQYRKKDSVWLEITQVLLGLLVILISIIFISTFKAAHRAISRSPSDSNSDQRNRLIMRQKIRLTVMFFLMFTIFIFGFIPVVVSTEQTYYLQASVQAILLALCLTSVLNPLLVLCFTKTFRVKKGHERVQGPHSIGMASIESGKTNIQERET